MIAESADVYDQAGELIEEEGYASVSLLEERLQLTHEKARQLLIRLIKDGKVDEFTKQHDCGWRPDMPYKKHWSKDDIFGWEGQD